MTVSCGVLRNSFDSGCQINFQYVPKWAASADILRRSLSKMCEKVGHKN